jgi:hypothetical protein
MGADPVATRAFVHDLDRDTAPLVIHLDALPATTRVDVVIAQGRVRRVGATRITVARAEKDRTAIGVVIGTAAGKKLGFGKGGGTEEEQQGGHKYLRRL